MTIVFFSILCLVASVFSEAAEESRLRRDIDANQGLGDGAAVIRLERELERFHEDRIQAVQTAWICLTISVAALYCARR